jgi:hypothetical protein
MNALPAVEVVLETVTLARIAPDGSLRVVQLTVNGDDELDPHPASSSRSIPMQAMAGGRHFTN